MATFLSDRPFSGVRQMKYEQMLAERPETVHSMGNKELEEYLDLLEQRYLDRTMELLPSCLEMAGATEDLKASDWMANLRACEQGQRMASEMALTEMLEA